MGEAELSSDKWTRPSKIGSPKFVVLVPSPRCPSVRGSLYLSPALISSPSSAFLFDRPRSSPQHHPPLDRPTEATCSVQSREREGRKKESCPRSPEIGFPSPLGRSIFSSFRDSNMATLVSTNAAVLPDSTNPHLSDSIMDNWAADAISCGCDGSARGAPIGPQLDRRMTRSGINWAQKHFFSLCRH